MKDVFITDLAAFLPNNPVSNEEMDNVIGTVEHIPTRVKRIVLKSNAIQTRYYAIDPKTGKTTHTNAQLAAEAVRRLKPYESFSLSDIECLCCGTATPDQLMPGHGLMVHGELKSGPCEVVSTASVCISGMTSLKYAYMNVALGLSRNAVAVGSDVASPSLRARSYKGVVNEEKVEDAGKKGEVLPFDTVFLRWMLSDAAGAAFMTADRQTDNVSLKIEWIENISFAGEMETCMYSGAKKNSDGSITGWREFTSPEEALKDGAFLIQQDVKLLNSDIMYVSVDKTLPHIVKKHGLSASGIDWLLPHYSSGYFRQRYYDQLKSFGFEIPYDKWFTNLSYKGNTGAASMYVMLEELFHSGKLEKGQKILCYIPESARFSVCYVMLTVV
ncbi:MAG TPA: beta-ketoacyl-ACP synthase III [Syntrophorhabdaceae bacterium]|nr:beta-ketoacyl-ACP synthase III [Syntrophorhabdaceae bacterium]